ncbi:glycosyltransferase family 4 protein [Flavobacteriaceae bacterium F08102]|nr:glycosyltransferase family 4 protein [Flavobacteriaceae bacterium F08102]
MPDVKKHNSKLVKIVLVTPLLDHGGGQRFVTELANHWAKQGHDVTIVLLRSGASFYPLRPEVKVIALGYTHEPNQSKWKTVKSGIETFFKLRRVIRSIRPRFVLSILSSTNILTLAATRFTNTKVYVNDIMSPYRNRSTWEKRCRKLLYRKADGVIALTGIAKSIIQKETKNPHVVAIPNPVKKIVLDQNIAKEKMILNVGRLDSAKGQHFLIDAFYQLNRPDYRLVILGEGDKRKSLEKQIKSYKLEDTVLLPGAVIDIDPWLAKAEIFAFPSVTESWGLALTEAMAAGLPCVSFDCEVGPREMINDGKNGFLIPVGDVGGLRQKLAILIGDPKLRRRLGNQAKIDAEMYNIEHIGDRFFNFCTNNEYC